MCHMGAFRGHIRATIAWFLMSFRELWLHRAPIKVIAVVGLLGGPPGLSSACCDIVQAKIFPESGRNASIGSCAVLCNTSLCYFIERRESVIIKIMILDSCC